jgi:hypothetical protein
MKMRNLSGAIRKTDGPVFVDLNTSAGVLRVPLQKSGLLAALKDLPLDPQDETDMAIDDAGVLTWKLPAISRQVGAPSPATLDDEQIDIEELTGPATTLDDDLAGLFG